MKTVKLLVGLLIVVGVFWLLWKVVPPIWANYQLEDVINAEARINTYTNKSEEDMRQTIYRKAQDLDIPLTHDQINVTRGGNTVSIWVDYTVHVELPIHPFDMDFHTASKNKGI